MFDRDCGKDGVFGFNSLHRIYIGRENKTYQLKQSPLANPFIIGKHGSREQVIAQYREWLWKQVKDGIAGEQNAAWNELKYLQSSAQQLMKVGLDKLTLTCWCKDSELCHGDIVINCLKWMNDHNL